MLTINKRFQDLLPPLSDEEYERLDASIQADGIRDPIVRWGNIIVDGHNRYKIAQKRGIGFQTVEKYFEDEDDACIWIIENQISKRNLTIVQRTFKLGELYKLKKKKQGAPTGNKNSEKQCPQNEDIVLGKPDGANSEKQCPQNEDIVLGKPDRTNSEKRSSPHFEDLTRTAERIAKEQNVSKATVERAADFHSAVTDIAEQTGQSTREVLDLVNKTSKRDVMRIAKMPEPMQKEVLAKIATGGAKSVVAGLDDESYPAKKNKADKPKPMTSFGELAASLPYSYEEQVAAQAVVDAVFALPTSLTLRIHEGRLIITSTDSEKPTLRDCPLQRGTNWKNYPIRPFFKFSATDFDILEDGGICTVGDLAKLITTDPKECKTLPRFGRKKLAHLEKQFEDFWMEHPELCNQ